MNSLTQEQLSEQNTINIGSNINLLKRPQKTEKRLHSKGHFYSAKHQPIEWENNFTNYRSNTGLISKIHELNMDIKISNPI